MNPKIYARILRFSKAYRMHEASPKLAWIKVAYEAEYFDQMHMIRDFFNAYDRPVINSDILFSYLNDLSILTKKLLRQHLFDKQATIDFYKKINI